jgi:hypothetical protein
MRIAMVTLAIGDDFQKMAELTNPAKEAYCRRLGYDFYYVDQLEDSSRPPAWGKIPAILHVLPRYDWVIWVDADTVLWNDAVGLRRYIASSYRPFLFGTDMHGVNSGVFFIRNTPEAHHVLMRAYDKKEYIHHPLWEQAALWEVFRESGYSGLLERHPDNALHPPFHGFFYQGAGDYLFLHLAGIRGPERLQRIEHLTRLAALPPAQRMWRRDDLGDLLNRCGLLGEGVEVGVASGEFSRTILDRWEGRCLHLVDAWRHVPSRDYVVHVSDSKHEQRFQEMRRRLQPHEGRFQVHRRLSTEAADRFADASLDFVYLDADHSREGLLEDLEAWHPKVRAGGVIAGHDYCNGRTELCAFGVKSAVASWEKKHRIQAAITSETDFPTWYFFKPAP